MTIFDLNSQNLKHIIAIALLLSISYQFVAKMGVIAWYEINKDYIAAELCENKDKPKLECNGKCYLKKQIQKVEDQGTQDEKNTPSKNKKTELPEYVLTATVERITFVDVTKQAVHDHYTSPRGTLYIHSIFHPPRLLV